jgi:hypothetical protein
MADLFDHDAPEILDMCQKTRFNTNPKQYGDRVDLQHREVSSASLYM